MSQFKKLFSVLLLMVFAVSANAQSNIADAANPANSNANFDSAITISDVQIIGNQLVPTDVILKKLKTRKGSKFSRRAISYDLKSLDNLGYFDKKKLLATPIPQGDKGVLLRIEVVENSPITGLIIKGNDSLHKDQIEEYLTPLVGMPRSSRLIKEAIDKIETLYHDEGYLLASVTELHFDPDGYLMVSIDEGQIGEIEFIGNDRTKASYLKRIMPEELAEGLPYNEKHVLDYLSKLQKTGFFKDARRDFSVMPENPSKHKLTFRVQEQRTKSLSLGSGLGTLNGLFGNVGFTEPNFRGRGETISFNGIAGTGLLTALDGDTNGRFARRGDFQFQASYTDPFFLNQDDMGLSVGTSAIRQGSFLVDSAIQRQIGANIAVSKFITKDKRWSVQGRLRGNYTDMQNFGSAARNTLTSALQNQEGYSAADADTIARNLRTEELEDGFYLDLVPSLVYRNIDETGTGWSGSIFGGPSVAIGDAGSYLSAGADIRRYDRLTDAGTFFKTAFRAEGLFGDPASFRNLRASGPYGTRGYRQFLDVGRGPFLLSNTAELAIPLALPDQTPLKDTKIVFFNDLGFVAGDKRLNDLYNRESVVASIGVGIEVNIPVMGPLRIDYGIPLIRPDSKSFWSGRITVNPGGRL